MASGLQVWSQTAASNSNADSTINWAEGQAPSSVNDSARALMASMAKWRDDNNGTLATTGSSAAFTVTSNQTEGSLTDGYTITAKFHATNDSSATLAVDSLAPKPIQLTAGTNVGIGQIPVNSIQRMTYSSGSAAWILQGAGIGGIPPGAVTAFAGASAPGGWLLCDGSPYSRTTYATLFAAVSTVYGSSDSLTFKVPDLAGRTIAGKEASATRLTSGVGGVDGGTLGAIGGTQSVTLTTDTIPAHSHTATDSGHSHAISSGLFTGSNATAAGPNPPGGTSGSGNTNVASAVITVGNTGGGSAHANVQPTMVMNYIIKT